MVKRLSHTIICILSLLATIVATDLGYKVTFTARDNNSQVLVFKQCWRGSKLEWQSAQGVYIDMGQTEAEVQFHNNRGIPAGTKCTVVGYVYAYQVPGNTDAAGNADPEYIAESTEYLEVEP